MTYYTVTGEPFELDNIVIHSFPNSPTIVKAAANFRNGRKIRNSLVMKDVESILAYLDRHTEFKCLPYRIITHK